MEIWLTFRNAVKLTLTKTRNWPKTDMEEDTTPSLWQGSTSSQT
jgi:hypothetical protein